MDNEKRAELHLHTRLSEDVSLIAVNEAFAAAEAAGVSAIGFTNLGNAQDFHEIAYYAERCPSIKAIYGAELFYETNDKLRGNKLTVLAKNREGVKALYRVVSSKESDGVCELIDLSLLEKNRSELLIGSAGNEGELFSAIELGKTAEEIEKIAAFYDYFELYPTNEENEMAVYNRIYQLGEQLSKPVVAVGNCHCIDKDDVLARRIVLLGRGLSEDRESRLLLDASEMLSAFFYLGEAAAKKTVLENTNLIADMISPINFDIDGYLAPVLPDADEKLRSIAFMNAEGLYGAPLPEMVKNRLTTELLGIVENGFSSSYMLTYEVVQRLREKGIKSSLRGAGGSMLSSFLLGFTRINPLSPHYYCEKCHHFEEAEAYSGFDLQRRECPSCQTEMKRDGQGIPFETFTGFKMDKLPDFDICVPLSDHDAAKQTVAEIFGEDRVAMAGTVSIHPGNILDSYIAKYEEDSWNYLDDEKREKLIARLDGIRVSEGVHPGGIIILPEGVEFEDFTPLKSVDGPIKKATHLDFHNLYNNLLKFDIIGSNELEIMKQAESITGVNALSIDLSDERIYTLLSKADTDGIPSCSLPVPKEILLKSRPKNFGELIKVMGFAHGTNTWWGLGKALIEEGTPVSAMPTLREDVFCDLLNAGASRQTAFKISEAVRKGLFDRGKATDEMKEELKIATEGLPEWYADYIKQVRYVFPKAHAVEEAINHATCAFYKINYPTVYKKIADACMDK